MDAPIEWLLEEQDWVAYRTRRDLLGQDDGEPVVRQARAALLADARVHRLLAELAEWPGAVIASHKSAGQPFHRLTFLAELGLQAGDPGVDQIVERVLAHRSAEGPFQLMANIPEYHGGTGQELWGWALCDAPLSLYALAKFGLQNDPAVRKAAEFLAGLARENGWPCAVSKELNFRGPGRKEDPCPFATLAMLKALSAFDDLRDGPACRNGAETLLDLWQESRTRHPYIFYMGTDFRKLKAPFVWYDLLHVLDVLTRFDWLRGDERLGDMLAVMTAKADGQGRFTPDSVWAAWKDWDFGQKKVPSRGLTLLAWRVMQRTSHNPWRRAERG